jgi:hypothetical protein
MDEMMPDGTPKKKSGVLKWVLMGCGGLVLVVVIALAVVGYMFYRNINTNPAEAAGVAQEILPIKIPAGFKGQFAMNAFNMKMATLASSDGNPRNRSTIVLMAMKGGNADAMQKAIADNMARGGQTTSDVSEQRPNETFRFRGADVPAQVRAGPVRRGGDPNAVQYSIALPGKSGDVVMLMVNGSDQEITHEWVQNLLDSVG